MGIKQSGKRPGPSIEKASIFALKILLSAVAPIALALSAAAAPEQIAADKQIVSISSYGNGAAIQYSPATTSHGCAGNAAASYVFIDWSTNASFQAVYASAMMAFATGRTVGFGVDGCYAGYGGGVPVVYRIDVNQ